MRRLTILTPFLVLTLAIALAASASASPSNKWRLQFSGGANSDGIIVLRLSPVGGEPQEYTIAIRDGRSENGVAKDVTAGLKDQLNRDHYHVERDDGEDVLIKKRRGFADFDVEVISNTVKGVRINPDRE